MATGSSVPTKPNLANYSPIRTNFDFVFCLVSGDDGGDVMPKSRAQRGNCVRYTLHRVIQVRELRAQYYAQQALLLFSSLSRQRYRLSQHALLHN